MQWALSNETIFNIHFSYHALYENILEKSGFIEKNDDLDVTFDAENYLITKISLNNVCSLQLLFIRLREVYYCRFEKKILHRMSLFSMNSEWIIMIFSVKNWFLFYVLQRYLKFLFDTRLILIFVISPFCSIDL
jgi:hypothetical protein